MTPLHRCAAVLASIATVFAVAGCGEDSAVDESAPVSVSAMATSAATTTAEQAPTDANPKTTDHSSGAGLTVTKVDIGHHEGFDRVVYEFGGKGTPGWRVAYVDEAVEDGRGDVIEVEGQSILEVDITGSAYPFDSGVTPYDGPDPLQNPAAPVIAGVHVGPVFEGTAQSFVGVNAQKPPFRVTTLSNPTRLVVDVAA